MRRAASLAVALCLLAFVVMLYGCGGSGGPTGPGVDTAGKPAPPPPSVTNPALAYTDGRVIAVANAGGTAELHITKPPSRCSDTVPAWSPDGSRIAFFRTAGSWGDGVDYFGDLCTVSPNGTGFQRVLSFRDWGQPVPFCEVTYKNWSVDWTPEGGKLLYPLDSRCQVFAGDGYGADNDMAVVDVATGAWTLLGLRGLNLIAGHASLGPDSNPGNGTYEGVVAFYGYKIVRDQTGQVTDLVGRDLYVIRLDTDTSQSPPVVRPVGEPAVLTLSSGGAPTGLAFSPDGRHVAFHPSVEPWMFQVVDVDSAVPAFKGSPYEWCSTSSSSRSWHPTWSPDSQWIAFDHNDLDGPGGIQDFDIFRALKGETQPFNVSHDNKLNHTTPDWNPAWVNDLP